MINTRPAIVVVCYNRPKAMARALDSISQADYGAESEIPLVISIDNCEDTEISTKLLEIGTDFRWPYGPKRLIRKTEKLGLKKHIYECADLTEEYGSIVLIEDDIFVSPIFYKYVLNALEYFQSDERIAGISLYSHHSNPYLRKDFFPLLDGYDNYFIQFASSWGQVWSKQQWHEFRVWYSLYGENVAMDRLPNQVVAWPKSSWLKIFIKYMVNTGKYFVYPRESLTTNFGDRGTHFSTKSSYFQTPLQLTEKEYSFSNVDQSKAIYDAFFELEPDVLKSLAYKFNDLDLTVDLYGNKEKQYIKSKFVLTTQRCEKVIESFSNEMKPLLLNTIFNIKGNDIFLAHSREICTTIDGENTRAVKRTIPETVKEVVYRSIRKIGLIN